MYRTTKTILLLALAWFSCLCGAVAQETAVYRDRHDDFKRGMDYYREQLYGKARESFQSYLQMEPMAESDRANIYRLTARLYDGLSALRLGRADAEQALLTFIAENDPSDIANTAKSEIAGYYFVQKNYAKAEEFYRMVNQRGLSNDRILEVRFNLGYSLFVQEKFPESLEYFAQIKDAKTSRYYFPANYYYGCASFLTKKYNESMESFKLCLESKEYGRTVPYHICQIHYQFAEYGDLITFGEPLMGDAGLIYRDEMGLLIGQAYFQQKEYKKALPYLLDYVNKGNQVTETTLNQLAISQLETGDARSAIPNFMQLSGSKSALGQSANYNLGQCYAEMGNKASALDAYEIAAGQHYDEDLREMACFEFAALAAEVNAVSAAVDLLGSIPESSPRYETAQGMLGQILLASNDYGRALDILRKISNKTPKVRETLQKVAVKRGCQLMADNKSLDAVALFDEALQYPEDKNYVAMAHIWRGEALYRTQKIGEARQAFDDFLKAEKNAVSLPDNASRGMGHYHLGYAYLHSAKPDYKNAAAQFEEAVKWFQPRLKTIKDLAVTNGVYMDALLLAGDCYTGCGRDYYTKADGFFTTLINNNYKNVPEARFGKARIHNAKEQKEGAIKQLNIILNDYPNSDLADDAQYELGVIYAEMFTFEEAIRVYKALIARVPNSEFHNRALNNLGNIYVNQNDPDRALEYFKQTMAHNPSPEECDGALTAIEQIYVDQQRFDEYMAYRQTVLCGGDKASVDLDALKISSAIKLYNMGNYEKAIKAFDDFLLRSEKSPYRLEAFAKRGDSYKELGKYDLALVDFDSVLRRAPNEFARQVADFAGTICLLFTKNYPAAYAYFLQLDKYADDNIFRKKAWFGLLRSGDLFGRRDRAIELTQKILKLDKLTDQEKGTALLYAGINSVLQKQFEQARIELSDAIKFCGNTEDGARARYEMANLYYAKRDLAKALEIVKSASRETAAYKKWQAKCYLLMSDIYLEMNDSDLALFSLGKVKENCPGEKEMIEIADAKTKKIEQAKGVKQNEQPDEPKKKIKVD